MKNTIWKFALALTGSQEIRMPENAQILSVQYQADNLVLWAIVNPAKPIVPRTIMIFGTGHLLPDLDLRNFIGTVQDGGLVWHVFEDLTKQ